MSDKLIIAGLGNPGDKYNRTRHNIGFDVLDYFLEKNSISLKEEKKFASTETSILDKRIIFIKPLEFMNLSGSAVAHFKSKNGIDMDNILVLHDEIDFVFSKCKMKIGGGAAGHNGLKSIIEKIGGNEFHRLRIGVGKPLDNSFVPDYVLSKFTSDEVKLIPEIYQTCYLKIMDWIKLK